MPIGVQGLQAVQLGLKLLDSPAGGSRRRRRAVGGHRHLGHRVNVKELRRVVNDGPQLVARNEGIFVSSLGGK